MSTTAVPSQAAASDASVAKADMKLEVVIIPVSDVDRASALRRAAAANGGHEKRVGMDATSPRWLFTS